MHRIIRLTAPLLAALAAACDTAPGTPSVPEDDLRPPVRVADVRAAPAEAWHRYAAVVRARDRARPAFLHAGTLAERLVERGRSVARGDPLAVLHNPALAPALAAADGRVRELEARVEQLRRDVDRARTLHERDLIAEEEAERLEADLEATVQTLEQAKARRDEAREQVEETTLRAPFDAEVTDVLVEPGDFVAAGQPVLELWGAGALEAEIRVPAEVQDRLGAGRPVTVSLVRQGIRAQGRIERVGRAGSGLAPVVVSFPVDTNVTAGQSVRVHVPTPTAGGVQVPLSAVLDPGGRSPHVLRIGAGDRAERVRVVPGRMDEDWITVDGALERGDRVVTAGHARLSDGTAVRVLP